MLALHGSTGMERGTGLPGKSQRCRTRTPYLLPVTRTVGNPWKIYVGVEIWSRILYSSDKLARQNWPRPRQYLNKQGLDTVVKYPANAPPSYVNDTNTIVDAKHKQLQLISANLINFVDFNIVSVII